MSEYKLANGTTITDADIDQLCAEFESESWAGRFRPYPPRPGSY